MANDVLTNRDQNMSTLVGGIIEDAQRLIQLVRGIPCKINLLNYNENPFVEFRRSPESVVLKFQNILLAANLTATYRRSRGRDVAAACGQLRTQHEKIARRLKAFGAPKEPRTEYSWPKAPWASDST